MGSGSDPRKYAGQASPPLWAVRVENGKILEIARVFDVINLSGCRIFRAVDELGAYAEAMKWLEKEDTTK